MRKTHSSKPEGKFKHLKIAVMIWGWTRLPKMGQPWPRWVIRSWWRRKSSWSVWRVMRVVALRRRRVRVISRVVIFRNAAWKRRQNIRVWRRRWRVDSSPWIDIEKVFVHHHHAGRVMTEQRRGGSGGDDGWRNWTSRWRHAVRRQVDGAGWCVAAAVKGVRRRQRKVIVRKAWSWVRCWVVGGSAEVRRISRGNVEAWVVEVTRRGTVCTWRTKRKGRSRMLRIISGVSLLHHGRRNIALLKKPFLNLSFNLI